MDGDVEANLRHAEPYLEQAAAREAQLVLLPEFYPSGYIYSEALWDTAEPADGPTVRWMRAQAARHGFYLGTSFLEAEGEHFYNTFVLVTPEGTDAGRVRKQTPAAWEAFFTRGYPGSHTIDTDIGRIGVGICLENQLSYTPGLMHAGAVDLMLMPHSAPTPAPSLLLSRAIIQRWHDLLEETPLSYARMLGVPVAFVNKVGPWESALPGVPLLDQRSSFPGITSIVDSDGTLRGRLDDREGVVSAEVTLDERRREHTAPTCRGYWALDVPWQANVLRVVQSVGSAWYRLSPERRRRALSVSRRRSS
jgi:N-carbamoylputrescine amidase